VELGSQAYPYDELSQGLAAAGPGESIWIKPGESSETLVIDQSVKLKAAAGPVRIGVAGVGRPDESIKSRNSAGNWLYYK
jgi:hypothetical protein